MNHLARNTAIVLATLAVVAALWTMREMVALFLVSLAVAAAVRPVVQRLIARGWRRGPAVGVVYLTGLALLVGSLCLLASPLVSELREATGQFAHLYQDTTGPWQKGTGFERAIATHLPAPEEVYKTLGGEKVLTIGQAMLGVTWNLFENLVRFLLILVLSVYWSLDRIHFERLWLSLLPPSDRIEARNIWQRVESGVGAYLRSELIQGVLAGVLLGIGYHALGLRFGLLLAILGALAWLIPWLGLLIAIVPAFLVGWHQHGIGIGVLTACYATGVFLVLEFFVEPRFFNRQRYSSLLVALVAVALASNFGLVGLLCGPPLAVTVQICFAHKLRRSILAPGLSQNIAELQRRLDNVHESLARAGSEPPPELSSVVQRLHHLVEDAQSAIGDDCPADAA